MKYKNLILDFSGTVADDQKRVHTAVNETLRAYNRPEIDFHTWKAIMSLDFRRMWDDLGVSAPLKEIVAKYAGLYHLSKVPINPIQGNTESLGSLSKILGRKAISILSSCPQEDLESHLEELGLRDYIGRIIGDRHQKQEDLAAFHGKNALYVGDMEQDAIAANSAGIDFAAVNSKFAYHPIERLARHHLKYLINHLKDLVKIVQNGR